MTTERTLTGRISLGPYEADCTLTLKPEGGVHVNAPEPLRIPETPPAKPAENASTPADLSVSLDAETALPFADFSAIEARVLGGIKPGHTLIFLGGRLPGRNTWHDALSALLLASGDASDRMLEAVKAFEEKGNLEPLRDLVEEHVMLFGNSGWPDLKTKVETYRRLYSLGQGKGPVTHEELQGLMSINKRLNDTEMAEATGFDPVEPIIVPGGAHKKKAKAQWKNEKRGGYFKR